MPHGIPNFFAHTGPYPTRVLRSSVNVVAQKQQQPELRPYSAALRAGSVAKSERNAKIAESAIVVAPSRSIRPYQVFRP